MNKKSIDFSEFQSIAKDVLKRTVNFCNENSLKYYLGYGTLLGAVRHNDIIPWDYDIDILMPRKDFNKFLELTIKNNPIENTEVFSWLNRKEYYLPFIKVCDSRTRLVITKTVNPIPFGIWVDIFPLDGAPDDDSEGEEMQEFVKEYTNRASLPYIIAESTKSQILRMLARIKSGFIPSSDYIRKAVDTVCKYDYDSSEYIACISSLDATYKKEKMKKEWFDTTVDIKFGDDMYKCPSGYNEVLTQNYGKYMELPPENDRKIPNIQSYWVVE